MKHGRAPVALVLTSLTLVLLSCGLLPRELSPTPGPRPTPTTIVMVVTVPPPPTAEPTPSPTVAPKPVEVDSVITLASDGLSVPARFTLAGGDYLFSWVITRPTDERGCVFDAMLTSEPTVSPLTLRSLGPLTVLPEARLVGSKQIVGLGIGGYTLRPNGDCRWTVTVTPARRSVTCGACTTTGLNPRAWGN